jgi:hypothetical protein
LRDLKAENEIPLIQNGSSPQLHKILAKPKIVCRFVFSYMRLSPERILISCRFDDCYFQSLVRRPVRSADTLSVTLQAVFAVRGQAINCETVVRVPHAALLNNFTIKYKQNHVEST